MHCLETCSCEGGAIESEVVTSRGELNAYGSSDIVYKADCVATRYLRWIHPVVCLPTENCIAAHVIYVFLL